MPPEAARPKPLPKMVIRLFFLLWTLLMAAAWAGAFFWLMIEEPDRGRGFGLMGLALLLMMVVGWKVRWLQKRGLMGAPPAP